VARTRLIVGLITPDRIYLSIMKPVREAKARSRAMLCYAMLCCAMLCYVCMYVRTYVRAYVCMYVCMYVCVSGIAIFFSGREAVGGHGSILAPQTQNKSYMCIISLHYTSRQHKLFCQP
jgi:hypothetical protein